jgi:hypothetical protein
MTPPPFSGSIEFKLSIRAFDASVNRKALVAYTSTLTWPYYHVRSREERTREFQLDLGLSVLAIPRSDEGRTAPPSANEPYWVPLSQLLMVGVLRTQVYAQLYERIDHEAQNADRDNRMYAGLPVPPLPEQI